MIPSLTLGENAEWRHAGRRPVLKRKAFCNAMMAQTYIIVYMLFCAFCYSFCVFAMPIRYLTFVNIGSFFTYNSMLRYASI